jgi:hypothetical protein
MGEFVAAPSPPVAEAGSGTLPLCPIAIAGVAPIAALTTHHCHCYFLCSPSLHYPTPAADH